MKRLVLALLPFLLLILLAACLPTSAAPLLPTATSTASPPTETPTPTVIWFPPTPTFTPYPTAVITPTVDVHPQYGELLLEDDFSDPEAWTLSKGPAGSAALGKNELTLAVSQPGGYLYSLMRGTTLKDFYLEMTASPSICRDEDEYGLLLRFSETKEFYRFALTCNGQARLDKYFDGRASSPQPPLMSGAIPPGAPSTSRIAVLALGKKMDFFVNDEYLFTVSDPSLISGSLGVFARSEGDNAVTVNFSDLKIYQAGGS